MSGYVCILTDPNAPHADECNFWHGWPCNCTRESKAALERDHCHECDWMNSYTGSARCNCEGRCICDREAGCPCIGLLPAPVVAINDPETEDNQ